MSFRVRALTAQESDAIAGWRYAGRYTTYQFDEGLPDPAHGFFAVGDDSGQMVGYCCYGAEARVPGVEPVVGVVDVGYGMRPDLAGLLIGRDVRHIPTVPSESCRFRPLHVRPWVGRSDSFG